MKRTWKKMVSAAMGIMMFCAAAFAPVQVYAKENQETGQAEEEKTSSFLPSGRIWIAGDSIAADHSYEDEAAYARFVHGWGEMIGNYLTEDAQVFNKAISGQTAKFFTEESNYQDIMDGIGEGDFLLIQFGHNDYKSAGSDHWSLSTDTEGSYKWYLKNYYIEPALKKGAMPVLCTSVVQCRTEGQGTVSSEQAQKKFAIAMKQLYDEYCSQGIEIGYIDTYSLTQNYLGSYTVNASELYALKYDRSYLPDGTRSTSLDHVHFSAKGADMTANMIAQNLMLMYENFNRFSNWKRTAGGDGTKENPYLIHTWCQLYQIMQDDTANTPEHYYKLRNDLFPAVQQQKWTTVFRANLDGDGHTIYNPAGTHLSAVFDENYGTVENVKLAYNVSHNVEQEIAFVKNNYGVVSNCTAIGDIELSFFESTQQTSWTAGCFVSDNQAGASVVNCKNEVDVDISGNIPQVYLGGITGRNDGTIRNCSNSGNLLVDTYEYDPKNSNPVYPKLIYCLGGIAGIEAEHSQVTDCSSKKVPRCKTSLVNEKLISRQNELIGITTEELSELQASKVMKGDVDGDRQITLKDAQLALQLALKIVLPVDEQLKAADINEDGSVSLEEAKDILLAALKIQKL